MDHKLFMAISIAVTIYLLYQTEINSYLNVIIQLKQGYRKLGIFLSFYRVLEKPGHFNLPKLVQLEKMPPSCFACCNAKVLVSY